MRFSNRWDLPGSLIDRNDGDFYFMPRIEKKVKVENEKAGEDLSESSESVIGHFCSHGSLPRSFIFASVCPVYELVLSAVSCLIFFFFLLRQ
jgi:hypothetical protein